MRCEAAPLTFEKQSVEAAVSSQVERFPYYLQKKGEEKKYKDMREGSESERKRDGETRRDSRAAPIR